MIKAVVFDIDGVLLDSFDANLRFFQTLMVKFGFKPPTKRDYANIFHMPMLDVIKTFAGNTGEDKVKEIFEAGLKRDDAANDARYPIELLKIPEGAHEVVKTLSQKYPITIVTSRVKEGIYTLPSLAEMQKYIQVTISYQDTKNHKPHPEPLLLAAERLDVKSEEVVYRRYQNRYYGCQSC